MNRRRNASLSTENSDSPQESGNAAAERELLNREAILSHLHARIIGSRIILLEEIDSTNAYLQRLPKNEVSEGAVVVAEYQTAGKGRHGRTWIAPPRANLLFSLLLSPPPAFPLTLTPLVGAVAVAEAVGDMGLAVGVKWPNDVVFEGRKLAGVLCETRTLPGGGTTLILGIGVNVNWSSEDLPEDLRRTAVSTLDLAGIPFDRNRLLATMLGRLDSRWEDLKTGATTRFLADARSLCVTLGRATRIEQGDRILEGTALDLDDKGGLLLRLKDGNLTLVEMGEIAPGS